MSQKNKKQLFFGVIVGFVISFLLLTAVIFFVSDAALAQVGVDPEYGTTFGLGTADLMSTVIKIVQWALGFLGLIAVIMIMYGGFVWMTAAGNTDKVAKAKKIIIRAAIGLAIILLAWAITLFIMKTVSDVTGGGGVSCVANVEINPPCGRCNNTGDGWFHDITIAGCAGGADTFRTRWVDPSGGETKVPLCSIIQAEFNGNIRIGSINPDSDPFVGNVGLYVQNGIGNGNGAACPGGHADCASGVCTAGSCVGDGVAGIWQLGGNSTDPSIPNHCHDFVNSGDEPVGEIDCGGSCVPCANIDASILEFLPDADYLENEWYQVELRNGAGGILEVNPPARSFIGRTWQFQTGSETLSVPPIVTNINPLDDAANICLNTPIQAMFSSKMRASSINMRRCSVTAPQACSVDADCPGGETCIGTVEFEDLTSGSYKLLKSPFGYPSDKKSFSTRPAALLETGNEYEVRLIAGDPASSDPYDGIMDVCLNHLDGNENTTSDGTAGGDDFMTVNTPTFPPGPLGPPPIPPTRNSPPWSFFADTDTSNIYCIPEITGIVPGSAKYGDPVPAPGEVTISGSNFGITGDIYFNNGIIAGNTSCFDLNPGPAEGYPSVACIAGWNSDSIQVRVPGGPVNFGDIIPSNGAKDGPVVVSMTPGVCKGGSNDLGACDPLAVPTDCPGGTCVTDSNGWDFNVTSPQIKKLSGLNNQPHGGVGQYVTLYKRSDSDAGFGNTKGRVLFRKLDNPNQGNEIDGNFPPDPPCDETWLSGSIVIKVPDLTPIGVAPCDVAAAGGWNLCPQNSHVGIQIELPAPGLTRSNLIEFIYTNEAAGPGLCGIAPNTCGTGGDPRTLQGENFGDVDGTVNFILGGNVWNAPLQLEPPDHWVDTDINIYVPNIDNADEPYDVTVEHNNRVCQGGGNDGMICAVAADCPGGVCALLVSNALPFTVPCGGVPKVVEDPTCDNYCVGDPTIIGCTSDADCGVNAPCVVGMASPNPYKNSVDVCTNAIMAARFTVAMDPLTLISANIKLYECTDNTSACATTNEILGTTINTFAIPDDDRFTLIPPAPGLSTDQYYKMVILKDVESGPPNPGVKMNNDYEWIFKTKGDPAPCPVENVMVTPPNAQLILIPDAQGYIATPVGPNCTLVNPGDYTWIWESSNLGVATITNSETGAEIATSVAKGSTYIKAEAEGKSGQGLLKVDPDSCAFDPNRCADPIPGGVRECPGSVCDVIADRCMPVMTDWDGDGLNFTPPSGPPGTTLSVEGCWFGNNPGSINIGGLPGDLTTCANSWSNNLIVATTDAALATGAHHLIEIKTEAGRCNGGANNGKLCTNIGDCPGGLSCDNFSTLIDSGQAGNQYEFFATINCARLCDSGSDNAYAYCTGNPDCINGSCGAGVFPPGAGVPGLCRPLQPNTGKEGTQINIDGLNFGPPLNWNESRVYYPVGLADTYMDVVVRSGVPAWNQTIISPTVVPIGAESGGVNVQVNNCPSNALPFGISCSSNSDCATNCCKFDGAVGAKVCKPFAECSSGTPGTLCQIEENAATLESPENPNCVLGPIVAAGEYQCMSTTGDTSSEFPPPPEPPGFGDDCRVCCDPDINNNGVLGEAGDQQVSTTGLECTADVGNCDTNERGLYCGCTADDQCQSPPTTIGCGLNDGRADHCCYDRPFVSATAPIDGDVNVCRNAAVGAFFSKTMDPTSFKAGRRPVSDDAIGVWHLDEGSDVIAGDSSGSNYHGTLMNGTTWSSGRYDNGILFDGADDHIIVDDLTFPDPGMDSYSISFWLKRPVGSGDDKMASKGWWDAATATGWGFRTNFGDRKLYLNVGDGTTYRTVIEDSARDDDKWHHYVGVIDRAADRIFLYRDGVLQPVAASSDITGLGSIAAPIHNLYFGVGGDEFNNPDDGPFAGKIDEIRIYNRALAEQEIVDNYKAMVGNFELYDATNDLISTDVRLFSGDIVAGAIPDDVFEANQTVRAVVKGLPLGGVLSAEGVGMTNVNYDFDGDTINDSYSWTFTTGDIICEIDHLDFTWEKPVGTGNDPPSLFICAADGCDDGDAFIGEPGNQQSWSVIAQDVNNTLLAGNIDFTWTESDPKNIYTPTHDSGDTTQGCPNLSTDLLECYLTSDNENGCGNWQVTASGPTPAWGSVTQSAKICGRICEYPWPNPHAPDNDVLPFEDNTYNYSIWYCRGNEATSLLPELQRPGDLISQTFEASEAGVDELVKQQFFLYRDDTISDDAIGIRIYENENGKSPEEWYWNQFGLAAPDPQSLTIDGYPAVRSGRTVYVAVWNLSAGVLYPNIYLISYNENASQQTIDIYNRMLDTWEFNLNMMPSDKEKLQRDMRRINDLNDIYNKLLDYKGANGFFPKLEGGTYVSTMTTSKWPSWQETLGGAVGGDLPVDPLNSFDLPYVGPPLLCDEASGFDQNTCWNDANKQYECPGNAGSNSHIYQYLVSPSGESANLYANLEYLGPGNWVNLFPPPEPCSGISNAACDCFNYQFDVTGTATDHQGPVINSVDALASGAVNVIGGTRTLGVDVTDAESGVRQVEFYIDGFLKSTDGDGSDGWSWDFVTTDYTDGNHTILVRAYDNAGNWTDAVFAALVDNAGGVDTTSPFVTILSPGEGNTISGSITITVHASDNVSVTQLVIRAESQSDGTANPSISFFPNSPTVTESVPWNTATVDNGKYDIVGRACDAGNLCAEHTFTVTVDNGDTNDPLINSVEYSYDVLFNSLVDNTSIVGQPTIRVNATDDNVVNRVEFYVDNIFRGNGADQGGDNWDWIWDTTSLTNGDHTLIVYVFDAYGNDANQIVSVRIDNPVPDTEAPVVSFVVPPTPASGSAVDGIISIGAEATDNIGVRAVNFYVDYLLRSSIYSTNSGYCANNSSCTNEASCIDSVIPPAGTGCNSTWIKTYEWELNADILTDGWHTIQVDAMDAAGNRSSSVEIRINVRGSGGPDINNVCVGPPSGAPGTVFTFYAEVDDPEGVPIDGVKAYIQNPDEVNLETIDMPRIGGDEQNGQYEGFWTSTVEGAFYVDIQAMDVDGNVSEVNNIPGQWVCGSGAALPACSANGVACVAHGDCCSFYCNITCQNSPPGVPVITSLLNHSAYEAQPIVNYQIEALPGPILSYDAVGLPPGLAINTSTGIISGTINLTNSATFPVTISATNANGPGSSVLVLNYTSLLGSCKGLWDAWGVASSAGCISYFACDQINFPAVSGCEDPDDHLCPGADINCCSVLGDFPHPNLCP
jgi:hypothetical protein